MNSNRCSQQKMSHFLRVWRKSARTKTEEIIDKASEHNRSTLFCDIWYYTQTNRNIINFILSLLSSIHYDNSPLLQFLPPDLLDYAPNPPQPSPGGHTTVHVCFLVNFYRKFWLWEYFWESNNSTDSRYRIILKYMSELSAPRTLGRLKLMIIRFKIVIF